MQISGDQQPRDSFYKSVPAKKVKSTTSGQAQVNLRANYASQPSNHANKPVQQQEVFEQAQVPVKQSSVAEPGSNKAQYKSKERRVTASTRGITSGTNARVNTFDNRGIQAQQKQQKVNEAQLNLENRHSINSGPGGSAQVVKNSHHGHQNSMGGDPRSSSTQAFLQAQPKQAPTATRFQGQVQPSSSMNHQAQVNQTSQPKLNQRHAQEKVQQQFKGVSPNNPGREVPQNQSPKKNIYLLNYQGNVFWPG